MFFRKSPENFWNLIAAKYAASPIADVAAYEKKIEKLKSYLSLEDVVLDIGCGTGTQCGDLAGNVKQSNRGQSNRGQTDISLKHEVIGIRLTFL